MIEEGKDNLSHVEPDKEYMDQACKSGYVYDTDDSNDSDIPEEHQNGLSHNEYMRRYILNIDTSTWTRDIHGLFDYETRDIKKMSMTTDKGMRLVRSGHECKLHQYEDEIKDTYENKA